MVVTGFGPFGGMENPTEQIVRKLTKQHYKPPHVDVFETMVLEVSTTACDKAIEDLIERTHMNVFPTDEDLATAPKVPPTIWIHLGLNNGRCDVLILSIIT